MLRPFARGLSRQLLPPRFLRFLSLFANSFRWTFFRGLHLCLYSFRSWATTNHSAYNIQNILFLAVNRLFALMFSTFRSLLLRWQSGGHSNWFNCLTFITMNWELKKNRNHIPLTILQGLTRSVSARPSVQGVPGRVPFPGETSIPLFRILSFNAALSNFKYPQTEHWWREGGGRGKISALSATTGLSM